MNPRRHGAIVAALFAVGLTATSALAIQEVSSEADGSILFDASLTDITRLSIKGEGRVRRVITDGSLFEIENDEKTGDLFLRFIGSEPNKAVHETGYIVTENNETIRYIMRPVKRVVEPVIVTIEGRGPEGATDGDVVTSAGFGDDIAVTMSDIVRTMYANHVQGKTPKGGKNKIIASKVIGAWRASVVVLAAGKEFRRITPQELTGPVTRGVWIQTKDLGPKEATFAIIVEDK